MRLVGISVLHSSMVSLPTQKHIRNHNRSHQHSECFESGESCSTHTPSVFPCRPDTNSMGYHPLPSIRPFVLTTTPYSRKKHTQKSTKQQTGIFVFAPRGNHSETATPVQKRKQRTKQKTKTRGKEQPSRAFRYSPV
jgi:hypothetical protein